jgi:hypothetical protein
LHPYACTRWQTENRKVAELVRLDPHHEQRHQELILTDVKHMLTQNALHPVYSLDAPHAARAIGPARWISFGGEVNPQGFCADEFCSDNALPRHRVFIEPFFLSSRLVTTGEFLALVQAENSSISTNCLKIRNKW